MYRVMIVDDEIYITVLIRKLVDWSAFNMEVVKVCYNGVEAYECAYKEKYDVIILDVRMPGIDGLTLMEKLRGLNMTTRFIVISGHRSFDFARSAIRNDAEDYLVKPISREELTAVLTLTREKLDGNIIERERLNAASETVKRKTEQLRRRALEYLIGTEIVSDSAARDTLRRNYDFELKGDTFCAAQFVIDHLPGDAESLKDELLMTVSSVLNSCMEPVCTSVLFALNANYVVILMNYNGSCEAEIRDALMDAHRRLNEMLERMENAIATLCVVRSFKELPMFKPAIVNLERCALARVSLGAGGVLSERNLECNMDTSAQLYEQYKEIIREYTRSFNEEKLEDCIREILSRGNMLRSEDPLLCFKLIRSVLNDIYEQLNSLDLTKGQSFDQFCERYNHEIRYAYTPAMVMDLIISFIGRCMEPYTMSRSDSVRTEIRIAELYIREHYMEPISLSDVAEAVGYSPIYLSMVFKKEVGYGFSDYLTQVRLKMACAALKDITININEVSLRCGFDNAKYFSQVFKKKVGVTPSEYRKRHLDSIGAEISEK